MTAPKTQIKKIVDTLPEDSSYDEILRELAFHKMIEKGLKNSRDGKTISNEEMKENLYDLKLIKERRDEEEIDFEEYLKYETK